MLIPITPQKKEKKLGKRRKKAIVLKKTLMNLNAPLERKGKWVLVPAPVLMMDSGFVLDSVLQVENNTENGQWYRYIEQCLCTRTRLSHIML